jgi:RNA polymerase sigma factor for flagellar operon FliA
MLLEQLTTRQGLSFEQACAVLETVHDPAVGRPALQALYERLPTRARRHFVGEEALRDVRAADGAPDARIRIEAGAATAARAAQALAAELARLSPEEARIIEMRYAQGLTIADIARVTSRDAKPLYRRLQRLLDDMRHRLEAHGVSGREVLEMIGGQEVDLPRMVDCRDAR